MRSIGIKELTFGLFNNFNMDTNRIDPAFFVGVVRQY